MEIRELTMWINSLIGSEMIASLQYEFASHIVIGTDWDLCNTEFKQHADEEREHMNKLISSAIERDLEINTELTSIIQDANPSYDIMNGLNTETLVRFHFDAEEKAIQTYKQFYNLIKDNDITLADTIKSILDDEVEHRKDLKKMYSSISDGNIIESNISTNFSNLIKRLKNI